MSRTGNLVGEWFSYSFSGDNVLAMGMLSCPISRDNVLAQERALWVFRRQRFDAVSAAGSESLSGLYLGRPSATGVGGLPE